MLSRTVSLAITTFAGKTTPKRQAPSFMRALQRLTGLGIELVWINSHSELEKAIQDAAVDFAWCPPLLAVSLEELCHVRPLVAVGRGRRNIYYAALAVRREAAYRSTRDLKGCRVAWVGRHSAAGYAIPRLFLRSRGLEPRKLFREQMFAGSHRATLEALLEDRVDVAAVYAHEDPKNPKAFHVPGPIEKLRLLATAGPIPNDVIIACKHVDRESSAFFAGALLSLSLADLEDLNDVMDIARFEALPVGHLDPLRRLRRSSPPPAFAG